MKKQTRIALIPVGILLALGSGSLLVFQNCSNVKFAQEKDASIPSALVDPGKSCFANGVEYQNNEQWNEPTESTKDVSCPDALSSKQGYRETARFVCNDGSVNTMGTLSELIEPMSSCPAPLLSAAAAPSKVANGATTNLLVNSQAVHDVKYSCKSVANSNEMFKGNLAVGQVTKALSPIVEDLSCSVTAQTSALPITKSLDISVDCESSGKIKDPTTHMCVEFQCKTFTVIKPTTATGLIDVPARTQDGVCYQVKLMDAVGYEPSENSPNHDSEVIARHHGGSGNWNPYSIDRSQVEFIMRAGGAARQVKLSGRSDSIAPIRVDNFLVSGLAKKSVGLSMNSAYRSYGTLDCTIDGSNIQLRNELLPMAGFGPSGTATVSALDLTTQVSTEETYQLDVRALDCGGSRELSEIWLLFQ